MLIYKQTADSLKPGVLGHKNLVFFAYRMEKQEQEERKNSL